MKRAVALSERRPGALYPSFDAFVEKLGDPNRILQWTAVRVLCNLAAADSRRKVPALLPRFRRLLRRGELVLTNNTVIALGEVARHVPSLRKAVLAELLCVERYRHATAECKRISMGARHRRAFGVQRWRIALAAGPGVRQAPVKEPPGVHAPQGASAARADGWPLNRQAFRVTAASGGASAWRQHS